MDKYTVWEQKASGTRFYTSYSKDDETGQNDNEHHKAVLCSENQSEIDNCLDKVTLEQKLNHAKIAGNGDAFMTMFETMNVMYADAYSKNRKKE